MAAVTVVLITGFGLYLFRGRQIDAAIRRLINR
jgi:hypothetical protein